MTRGLSDGGVNCVCWGRTLTDEVSFGRVPPARSLKHRLHKWEPVLRGKMLPNKSFKHRTQKWEPVLRGKMLPNKSLKHRTDPEGRVSEKWVRLPR